MKLENNENVEAMKTVLAMIAHDLKSPICAQNKIIELFLAGYWGELNVAQKDILELMLLSGNYSQSLVNDIMDIYKCENNHMNFNLVTLNFSSLIRECKDMSYLLCKQKCININLQIPFSSFIFADEKMIKRAVMNIVSNAIKHAKDNTNINIILEERDNIAIFSVQNEGSYITNEILKNVFKKGYTSLSNGIEAGTGLGLYFVKNVIELHKGEVFAKSFECGTNIFGFILKKNLITS